MGGTLTQEGAGTLTLSGASTYGGGTTINPNSTLQLTAPAGAGTGTVTDNGIFNVILAAGGTITNAVTGTGIMNINGNTSGNTILIGSFSGFTGTINCNAGAAYYVNMTAAGILQLSPGATINITNGSSIDIAVPGGVNPATVVINGAGNTAHYGAYRMDNIYQSGPVLLAGTNNWIGTDGGTPTISGIISDTNGGNGLVVISGNSLRGVITLSGANTYTGVTTLSNGTLSLAAPENAPTSGPLGASAANNAGSIVFAGVVGNADIGSLQYTSANQFDYSGRFSTAANQNYSIDVNGQSVTFATPLISSGGSLTLMDSAGGGTLVLSGANTYNGGTIIKSGMLDINATGSIAGNVTVTNTGTLELDNASALASTATLNAVSGTVVNLAYSGTGTIGALFVGGVQQAPGVYGANTTNPDGVFSGTGTFTINWPSATLSAPTIAGGQLTITWASVSGATYNVCTTTNLSRPVTWTAVNSSPIVSQGTTTTYTLPGSTVGQNQLFAAVVTLP